MKDAGKRVFRIAEIQQADEKRALNDQFTVAWGAAHVESC